MAVYRARETERDDAVFRDPFARALAGERGERIASALTFTRRERVVVHRAHLSVRSLRHAPGAARRRHGREPGRRPRHAAVPDDAAAVAALGRSRSARHPRLQGRDSRRRQAGVRPGARAARSVERGRPARPVRRSRPPREADRGDLPEGLVIYLMPDAVAALARDLAGPPAFQHWALDLASPGLRRDDEAVGGRRDERGRRAVSVRAGGRAAVLRGATAGSRSRSSRC